MEDFSGLLDGSLKISTIDATMMWIVYYAMDKAHGKVKSKEGVIERLNEISKFYEFAVIQLEGCIKFVQDEADSYCVESCHEKVLADLTETRDRLLGRLQESELAISEKDRELMERLENELKLRQALEIKEREVVSLHAKLELERKKSEHMPEFSRSSPVSGDEDRDGEFCELRNSADQQVCNIKQKLQTDPRLDEERNRGIDDKKIEQMSHDINFLKETLDQAFRKMQNAIFLSELGPQEQEWRWNLEKDAIYILIKGFMKDFKDKFEVEMRKQEKQVLVGLSEHLSDLMKEVTCLRNELQHLINKNEDHSKAIRGNENLASPNRINLEFNFPHKPGRSLSEGDNMRNVNMFSSNVEVVGQNKQPEDEPEEDGVHLVAKMIKNHESIIRRKAEELNRLKRERFWERGCLKEKDPASLKRRIQEVVERMDNLIKWNSRLLETFGENGNDQGKETSSVKRIPKSVAEKEENLGIDSLEDVWKKVNNASVSHNANKELENEITILKEEKEDGNLLTMIMEDTNAIIFKGLVSDFHTQLQAYDIERDENFCSAMESALVHVKDECTLREDVCAVFFQEMCNEWNGIIVNYSTENFLREKISWIVFDETIRDIVNTANYTIRELQDVQVPENFTYGSSSCDDWQENTECSVKENEWKMEVDSCDIEHLIREEIHQFVFVEAVKGACLTFADAEAKKQEKTPIAKISGSGEESLIEKLDMLLKSLEEEEGLLSSKSSEMKDYNAEVDLVKLETEELNENEIFHEFLNEDETTFTSVRSKLEQALEQLSTSKTILSEMEPSFDAEVSDQEIVHHEISPTDIIDGGKSSSCQQKINQDILKIQYDSVFTPILGFSQVFVDFELQAHEKLGNNVVRLEEMKHQLDSLVELVTAIRKRELLYRKAFVIRCQNLQKAENEVDLLGDQVDVQLGVLEKIYMTLHQYSTVLQQYFDILALIGTTLQVSGILDLIQKELIGAVHTSSK
ncbi:WPP domain-associated protein-like [Pistacia vera]|uniref:WPP domain-associated protein-like n=1 Tax=Pistacia vera TaxID=55513 RepID=UPI0012631ECB|nr:WPP domain-associated protein-like [Pistacia vera]